MKSTMPSDPVCQKTIFAPWAEMVNQCSSQRQAGFKSTHLRADLEQLGVELDRLGVTLGPFAPSWLPFNPLWLH